MSTKTNATRRTRKSMHFLQTRVSQSGSARENRPNFPSHSENSDSSWRRLSRRHIDWPFSFLPPSVLHRKRTFSLFCNRLGIQKKSVEEKLFVLCYLRPFRKGIFSLSRWIRRRTAGFREGSVSFRNRRSKVRKNLARLEKSVCVRGDDTIAGGKSIIKRVTRVAKVGSSHRNLFPII